MRAATLLLPYVPSWCVGQVHLYFDDELKTSETGQCEILKLVKNYVLPRAENTFMVQELHSSRLLHSNNLLPMFWDELLVPSSVFKNPKAWSVQNLFSFNHQLHNTAYLQPSRSM
jgi:hypothetical protein